MPLAGSMLLPTYLTTDRSEDSYVWRDICIIRVVSAKGSSHICAEVENEEHAQMIIPMQVISAKNDTPTPNIQNLK